MNKKQHIQPVPMHLDADGAPCATMDFSLTSNTIRIQCTAHPHNVVPVVFVPGVMGSNLKASGDIKVHGRKVFYKGDRVWKLDTATSAIGWAKPESWWAPIIKGVLGTHWGRSPAYRQAVLNKDAVQVDNGGKIATKTIDGVKVTPTSHVALEEARKRGWGTPGWHYYGDFLDWLEYQLNAGALVDGKPNGLLQRFLNVVGTVPARSDQWAPEISDDQVKKVLDIYFPVYATGYNWLQSNLDSGADVVKGVHNGPKDKWVLGIDDIIARYDNVNGYTCDGVILVTHSMGGLVGRAAALSKGAENKVLGVVHGVQPIDGAAKFYKDLATGFSGDDGGIAGVVSSRVLGTTAREAIPEIAYNPGPLELAPNKRYNGGKPWLFIKDRHNKVLKALPTEGDPYEEIYLDTKHVWRAVNPAWLNPGGAPGNPMFDYTRTVKKAASYHQKLGGKLHPQTYAHWGDDPDKKSWGFFTWRAERGFLARAFDSGTDLTQPASWTIPKDTDDAGTERDVLYANNANLQLSVEDPADAGDGTVPAAASGAQIANYSGCKIGCGLKGFSHQDDFNNPRARDVLLDALVRLIVPVKLKD